MKCSKINIIAILTKMLFCVAFSMLTIFAYSEEYSSIDISKMKSYGIYSLEDFSDTPKGENGILKTFVISFPGFERGVYYSGDNPNSWPANHNRVLPYTFKREEIKDLNYGGMFLTLQLNSGDYLALVPMVDEKIMSWLHTNEEGEVLISLGTLGTASVSGNFNLFSWCRDTDLYLASSKAWSLALNKEKCPLREYKNYPEPFNYLGWCSWEQFKQDINSDVLVNSVTSLEQSKIPVRWVLVDDGHEEIEKDRLVSFDPDKTKFPSGWSLLLNKRSENQIKWFGLWHDYQGYWGGINPKNNFGEINKSLDTLPKGIYLPKEDFASISTFFDAYMKSVKKYGFDFVKIDDQSRNLSHYRGTNNAVLSALNYAKAKEEAVEKYQNSYLINCMAQNSTCVFSTYKSAVTRCSIDYKFGDPNSGKSHIWQSFNNSLWIGQSVWPDHDMFHSSDPNCGRLMAVSKSLSGAPIYISDAPGNMIDEYILPLSYEDGLLLRPIAPGLPLPESAFLNPLTEKKCYRVIAPLTNQSAAIALYNLNISDSISVIGNVMPSDYQYLNGLIQPYPGVGAIPDEGLVLYDWYMKKGIEFNSTYEVDLQGFSDRLLLVCPIQKGWAVIGRSDKYLSPSAVEHVEYDDSSVSFILHERGPLIIYSKDGIPQIDSKKGTALGNNFYVFDLPVSSSNRHIKISR